VCPRLAGPAPGFTKKADLTYGDSPAIYVEDPFDQRTNLGHGTTEAGRDRLMYALRTATRRLQDPMEPVTWPMLCPEGFDVTLSQLFLKVRLREPCRRAEVPRAVWGLFGHCGALRVFVSTDNAQPVEVYVQFSTWQDLRMAQSQNERRLPCCDQPIALYISLGFGLFDELEKFTVFSTSLDAGSPAAEVHPELTQVFTPLPFATRSGGFHVEAARAASAAATSAEFGLFPGAIDVPWVEDPWAAPAHHGGWDYGAGFGWSYDGSQYLGAHVPFAEHAAQW